MPGWNETKLNDPNKIDPKYVFGRLVQQFDTKTPEGRAQLLAALRADPSGFFKNATLNGDILDVGANADPSFGGDRQFDVFSNYNGANQAPWWYSLEQSARDRAASGAANGASPTDTSGGQETIQQAIQRLFGSMGQTTSAPAPLSLASTPQSVTSDAAFNTSSTPSFSSGVASPAPSGAVMPTGKPAVDGNTNWVVGAGVPSMPGYVYNYAGGIEPGGAGNAVPGMPGATYGSDGYTVIQPNGAVPVTPTTPTPTTTANTSTGASPNGFTDPATATLDQLISQRIAALTAPINDPTQAQAADAIQSRIGALNTPLATPDATQSFQQVIADAIAKLQGQTFSDPELAAMQARAFDTLNRQEQAEIDNTTRTLANHGVPPSSGLVQHAVQLVRNKYDELKAQQQQSLNQYAIDSANQRRAQLLQTAQTGSNVALTQQQIDEQRKNSVVDLANQLVTLARTARGEQNTNAQTAISLAGIPVDITQQRVNNALNAGSGSSAQASNITQTLSGLINQFNAQSGQNQANSANYWQNLAAYLSQIDWSKVFG